MELEPVDIQARLLMLEHVTSALWANFIANSGSNPVETCERVASESIDAIETIYERRTEPLPEDFHILVQHIIHHQEAFWRAVREQISRR